jgi:hypothetical protein
MSEETQVTESETPETSPLEETPEATPVEDTQVGNFEDPDYGSIVDERPHEDFLVEADMEDPRPLDPVPREPETPAPEEPAKEATAEVEEATPKTPESPPEEPQQPAQPEAEEPPAAEETPAETPLSEEEYRATLQAHMDKTVPRLESLYKLSEEEAADVDDLDRKPSEYLPKMMAQLHYNIAMSQRAELARVLPTSVQSITQQNLAAAKAEEQFFGQFPDLVGHKDLATRATIQIRQTNPNLKGEALMKAAGQLALASLGLPVQGAPTPEALREIPPAPLGVGQPGAPVQPAPARSYEEGVFAEMVEEEGIL